MLTYEEKKSDYLETLAEELRLNGFPVEIDNNWLVIQANYNNKTTKQQNKMKTFIAKQEIRDLLNKVIMDEVSFTRMVEIMNERVSERVSEAEKPCVEYIPAELKEGNLAIFWDFNKGAAFIGEYNRFREESSSYPHRDNRGNVWANAIKFESKEQYRKLLKGEK